jgi:GT2 family glycosyltransferase
MINEEPEFLVSVLIITFNGRDFLEDCLESVLDQDFPREQYEVIVMDNASADGSADFVEQNYPDVRVVRLDRNYGPSGALHHALIHIRGEYLAYINQDAVAHRRWLSELVEVMISHPDAGLVESNMILPVWPEYEGLEREELVDRAYVCDLTPYGVHDFRIEPVTPTSPPIPVISAYGAGCILNPRIIEKLGYWLDSDFFAYFDDIDLGLRLNAAGYQVLLAPRSVVYHDTDWHFTWDMRSIRRAFLSTRNMFLVFYKISYASEFIVLLPRLMWGKLRKAGQHNKSPVVQLAYALAGIPLLLVGFTAALLRLPSYRKRRELTLSRRKKERGWLTEKLLNPGWEPDPTIWLPVTHKA